jgi:hypothetical protein
VGFKAHEEGHYNGDRVSYSNDVSTDEERLVSTCGYNSSYMYGGWDSKSPEISCYYAGTGLDEGESVTYIATVYIQDDINDDDFSVYREFEVVVKNGTPGVDCNLACSPEEIKGEFVTAVPDEDKITDSEDIAWVVDTLTDQEPLIEGIMVIMFSLLIVFGLAKLGVTSPFIYAMSMFMTWIVCSIVGIMPWVYTVLFGFVSVALGALAFVMARGE